jgi:LAO/AO transport system kinase
MSKKAKDKNKALKEIEGVSQSISRLNPNLHFTSKNRSIHLEKYIDEIKKGNIVYLSKAITLIESTHPDHFRKGQKILKSLLPHTGNSIRIGVTGVPGVGKSTLIEKLGTHYTKKGHKVAVLAIDPSSSRTQGSILGDKTRMEQLSRDPNAYIRPTASGNALGGVARKTRETILLCEAAGFDRIIIETVGVGQSETLVHSMTDFFLLLKLAGAGDELQGIKRGIIEMADLIVINKAEGDNLPIAQLAQKTFASALHFYPPKESGWKPKVNLASALQNQGIDEIAHQIDIFIQLVQSKGFFEEQRKEQEKFWLKETVKARLLDKFYSQPGLQNTLENMYNKIIQNEITAFEAADILLKKFG